MDHSHNLSQKADLDGYVSPLQSSTSLASRHKEAGCTDVGLTQLQSGLQSLICRLTSKAAFEHLELVKEEESVPGGCESLTKKRGVIWVVWQGIPGEALVYDCGPWFCWEMGRQRGFEGWAGPWRAVARQSPPRPQEQDELALDRRHM